MNTIKKTIEMITNMHKGITYLDNSVDEVIAELKTLQHRSCESCVHRSFLDETLTNKVTNGFCMENGFFTKVGFCCNRYKAKE